MAVGGRVRLDEGPGFNSSVPPNGTVCFSPTSVSYGGIWHGGNPMDFFLPLFIMQVAIVVLTTRGMYLLLKPFRQPRVVAEIIGGVLLGPSVMGQIPGFADNLFPLRGTTVLETMAHLGLLYFLFLVGLEMNVGMIKRTGRKALVLALTGMFLPFVIATIASYFLSEHMSFKMDKLPFLIFLSVTLSMTAFPVLARILAELKLLNTEIGRIAMSSALINYLIGWMLLELAVGLSGPTDFHSLTSIWVLFFRVGFVLLCFFVIKPGIQWIAGKPPKGLTGVMACGLVTDALGIGSIFGAFVFGLVIPNGKLGVAVIERLEDFVSGLLLPLFFAISGLRTNIFAVQDVDTAVNLLIVIAVASVVKLGVILIVSSFYGMPSRDGLSLGFLMNCKGIIEMIVLNAGHDKELLGEDSFALMVISSVIMTAVVVPLVTMVSRPGQRSQFYERRMIQQSGPDSELRILACVHTSRNVPGIISLLDFSRPTKKAPLFVYALHLLELTGRESAMLIVNTAGQDPGEHGAKSANHMQAQSARIIGAFKSYEQQAGNVTVQPFTAISPYSTMHEDICKIAEDKRVTLIILPFHKQQTVDGRMESPTVAFVHMSGQGVANRVAVLFFGGPDCREALAYARNIAEHPETVLTVHRFLPAAVSSTFEDAIAVSVDDDRERRLDDEYVEEFRQKTAGNRRISYLAVMASNGEETVATIRSMGGSYDLCIVGSGHGVGAPLTSGMMDWSECPELGPIGDLMASSDFSATVSVLVVQQYVGASGAGDGGGSTESSRDGGRWARCAISVP
ncbi:unnamed protein product [Spirodela intermedia]|uniref:Uncharacterized protein n=1 Tax=Spirodela intermedia TaxID=51605 RepID=A0A7I8JLT2_SPIIN|nr:unnamed protein product [Spirodela intermedia]CAA6671050.1 unnamed protein product [Spirodela intermedia]